ncbi:MAG: EsaB/YukD family protein [Ktedonobacteraceae bacterium]|nr:EsaB/YukD family protein [Ktedonobacteraceae bacterium]
MPTLLITITTTQSSTDLEIPADVPIAKLLPRLVTLCVNSPEAQMGQWALWSPETRTPLDQRQSLLEAGIVDGAMLLLQGASPAILQPAARQPATRQQDSPDFQPRTIQPSTESGGIGVRWHRPS